MAKKVSINLDGVEVDISLDKAIEKEVERRLTKEREKIRKEFEDKLPVINLGGRRQGNTYRLLLYAQLLASGNPEQNIFVVAHRMDYAKLLCRQVAETLAYLNVGASVNIMSQSIEFPNGSRILFISKHIENDRYRNGYFYGLRNISFLYDN